MVEELPIEVDKFTFEYITNIKKYPFLFISVTYEDRNIYEFESQQSNAIEFVEYLRKTKKCSLCLILVNNNFLYDRLAKDGLIPENEVYYPYYDPYWKLYIVSPSCREVINIREFVYSIIKDYIHLEGRLPVLKEFPELLKRYQE